MNYTDPNKPLKVVHGVIQSSPRTSIWREGGYHGVKTCLNVTPC